MDMLFVRGDGVILVRIRSPTQTLAKTTCAGLATFPIVLKSLEHRIFVPVYFSAMRAEFKRRPGMICLYVRCPFTILFLTW